MYDELLKFAVQLAKAAGGIQLAYFRGDRLSIETKSNVYDVVTRADRESEGKEAEEDNDVCRERHDTAEELPKEDNTAARIPSRLRQIADASGGRIVIAGVGSPPENGPAKKGIKM